MTKKQVRVGIVCMGGAGRAHFWRYRKNQKAEVCAVYDYNIKATREFLEQQGVNDSTLLVTDDFKEFISSGDIDVVSICSPDYLHAYHAREALQHHLHVLCEKPLASTIEECWELVELAEDRDVSFAVCHQWHFVPTFAKVKQLVDSGALGRILTMETSYLHDMTSRAFKFDDWRVVPDSLQTVILGGGVHAIDYMRWVVNSPVVEVFAYANHLAFPDYPDNDTVLSLLRFANGAIGRVTAMYGNCSPNYKPFAVFGDTGTVINNVWLNREGLEKIIHVPRSEWRKLPGAVIGALLRFFPITRNYPFNHYEHELASRRLLNQFLDNVLFGTSVPVSIREGAEAVRIGLAIIQSYKTGKPVQLSDSSFIEGE